MFTEIQISQSGAILVLKDLGSSEVKTPSGVSSIQALDDNGIIPSILDEDNAEVKLKDGKSYRGKIVSWRPLTLSNDSNEGTRIIINEYESVHCPNQKTWRLIGDVSKETVVHASIDDVRWYPEYTMKLDENKKIKQLALSAVIKNSSSRFAVDRIIFRVSGSAKHTSVNETGNRFSAVNSFDGVEELMNRSQSIVDTVSLQKDDYGISFSIDRNVELLPQITIPLWSKSYQEYDLQYRYSFFGSIQSGYSIDLNHHFLPDGNVFVYDADRVCINQSGRINRNNKEIWVPVGKTSSLTAECEEIKGFLKANYRLTIKSSLGFPVTVDVRQQNGQLSALGKVIVNPGVNTFDSAK
jgi:hypothetical protein